MADAAEKSLRLTLGPIKCILVGIQYEVTEICMVAQTIQCRKDDCVKQVIRLGSLLLALCSCGAMAQVTSPVREPGTRQQITIQGSGIFTRKTVDSGTTYKPTSAGGFLVGYRLNIIRWLGVEGDFDYFRNSQKYLGSISSDLLKTNVQAATGAAVINIPNPLTKRLQSFVLIGGGALLFSPQDTTFVELDNFDLQKINLQMKPVIVFGGGVDIALTRRLSIRGQARNFMYKAPDFGISNLQIDKYSQSMIPSAGLVFKF